MDDAKTYTAQDLEYLRHGDRPLLLRLFTPRGGGPFPLVVDLHGGAWNKGDRSGCQGRDEVLVNAGLAVAALDFRQAADGYPASLADIHYAIRWLKANAPRLDLDPARVGLSGQSSGGHLAALLAMRPDDPRYSAIALDTDNLVDATVRCLVMEWPVINPLSRYHHALRCLQTPETGQWAQGIPEFHDIYWASEAAMAEGNPLLALARGEQVTTPPALWLQGTPDIVHDYLDPASGQDLNEPERFQTLYRKAGGELEIIRVPYADRLDSPASAPLAAFFNKYLG
ncbi:MAG: alpha/beta hydrolase [Rhodospirillales bacterium]|nr:alpha/beta hydrolase [Rhodospirillales bacterium]